MYERKKQEIILEYLKNNAYKMCREACGVLKYDFIDPGANYSYSLWDWDSYFGIKALIDITEKLKDDETFDYEWHRRMVIRCGKGCVLNFLNAQFEEGYIPICLYATDHGDGFFQKKHDAGIKMNQIKPFLAQFIQQVSVYSQDYHWFDLEKVEKYFNYYYQEQYDERTGMFVWQNDLMIGIDNNPTVFFRPSKSAADIYLNTLLYMDLMAFSELLEKIGLEDKARDYARKGEKLKLVINKEMYDYRDAFYYSQDVMYDDKIAQMGFHHGFPMEYRGLPIKIREWVGLLPLYAGISDILQAKAMVEKNFLNDDLFCQAGIRSLARNEKMFSEKATNNPSNHTGPVWIINNYMVWQGLKKYGFHELSEDLRRRTIDLLGDSIINNGGFYESYQGDGTPMLFCGFLSWNCLISIMLDQEEGS